MLSLFAPFRHLNSAPLCHPLLPMIGERGKLILNNRTRPAFMTIFGYKACLLKNPYKQDQGDQCQSPGF